MKKHLHITFVLFAYLLVLVSNSFAQTPKQIGIEHYKKKEYKEASSFLEKAKKENPTDFDAIFFLAVSLANEGKINQSADNFEKAIELNPNHSKSHTWLAYILLQKGNYKKSLAMAEKAAALNASDAENYYLIGSCKMKMEEWDSALENAEKAITINPKLHSAYLLKAQILISLYEDDPKRDMHSLTDKYGGISKNFVKYLSLVPKEHILKEQLDDVAFFIKAYQESENKHTEKDKSNVKPIKVLKKYAPEYTDQARQGRVEGSVRILAAFEADGKVSHAIVISGLGFGLDEQAIKAARKVKFEPREEDGKPVMAVKTVIYNFSLY